MVVIKSGAKVLSPEGLASGEESWGCFSGTDDGTQKWQLVTNEWLVRGRYLSLFAGGGFLLDSFCFVWDGCEVLFLGWPRFPEPVANLIDGWHNSRAMKTLNRFSCIHFHGVMNCIKCNALIQLCLHKLLMFKTWTTFKQNLIETHIWSFLFSGTQFVW